MVQLVLQLLDHGEVHGSKGRRWTTVRKVVSGTWGTFMVNLWKLFNIFIPDKNLLLCAH